MNRYDWVAAGLCAVWLSAAYALAAQVHGWTIPSLFTAIWDAIRSEVTAAWLQAIFSVAAIWFAGRSVLLEHRSAALKDMESLSGLVRAARTEVKAVCSLITEDGPERVEPLRAYPHVRLDKLADKLWDFPFFQLGSSKSPALMLKLAETLAELSRVLENSQANGYAYVTPSERDAALRAGKVSKKARKLIRRWAENRRVHRDNWWRWNSR